MSQSESTTKEFLGNLRQSVRPERADDFNLWLNKFLVRRIGNPDVSSLLCDISFFLDETFSDGLSEMIDPDNKGDIVAKLKALIEETTSRQAFYVCRLYSDTNKRELWKIESRSILDYHAAVSWKEYMDIQSKGKHTHFVVASCDMAQLA